MNIYYLTRTIPKNEFGGALMRYHTVSNLRKLGYKVYTLSPNYNNISNIFKNDDIRLRQVIPTKILLLLERLGILGDYLIPWANQSIIPLSKIIKSDDLIISTSGGELGMIFLGNKISKITNARHIVHLHDPVLYSVFDGHWIGNGYHRNRTKLVEEELSSAYKILSTSENTVSYLKSINQNTSFQYLGIPVLYELEDLFTKRQNDKVNIFYPGSIGKYQNIHKYIPMLLENKHFIFHIIGNDQKSKKYILRMTNIKGSNNHERIVFHGKKNKNQTDKLVIKHADYIFVSLDYEFLKFNFPSKIFDCLNLCIPAIYVLPDGSASRFIEVNKIGVKFDKGESSQNIPNAREKKYQQMVKNLLTMRNKYLLSDFVKDLLP